MFYHLLLSGGKGGQGGYGGFIQFEKVRNQNFNVAHDEKVMSQTKNSTFWGSNGTNGKAAGDVGFIYKITTKFNKATE